MNIKTIDLQQITSHLLNLLNFNAIEELRSSNLKMALALSGGNDSVALFHLLRELNLSFQAIHINHQISENASDWANFCRDLSQKHNISYKEFDIKCSRAGGESLEDIARRKRYEVFSQLDCDILFMAHHQDDQIETLFTQLFRGTGLNGLLGMPEQKNLTSRIKIIRPLLNYPKSELKNYLESHNFQHIEDESNQDIQYARNFWRNQIFPQIERFYPNYRNTIQKTQKHLQETFQLNQDIVKNYFNRCYDFRSKRLNLEQLQQYDIHIIKQVIRLFLQDHALRMPSEQRLLEIMKQLFSATDNAIPRIEHDHVEIRRFKHFAYIHHSSIDVISQSARISNFFQHDIIDLTPYGFNFQLKLSMIRYVVSASEIPLNQRLNIAKITQNDFVELKLRNGGERFSLGRNRPKRSLKQQFQTLQIPTFIREELPIFYIQDHVFYIPYLGVEADFQPTNSSDPFWHLELI